MNDLASDTLHILVIAEKISRLVIVLVGVLEEAKSRKVTCQWPNLSEALSSYSRVLSWLLLPSAMSEFAMCTNHPTNQCYGNNHGYSDDRIKSRGRKARFSPRRVDYEVI